MKKMFLYGIGGASDNYRCIRYTSIPEEDVSVLTLKYEASHMRGEYPNVQRVFAMDDRPGLAWSYRAAIKKNALESHIIFRDILERQGIEIN